MRNMKEDSIIIGNYKSDANAIHLLIPYRSIGWIRQRAFRLGVSKKVSEGKPIQIGERISNVIVLAIITTKHRNGTKIRVFCLCNCGVIFETLATHLRSGHTTSCGCQQKLITSISHSKKAGHSIITQLMKSYKSGAVLRNLPWEISREEFEKLVKQNCHYCNVKPSNIRVLTVD